jgi:hypothetical protein
MTDTALFCVSKSALAKFELTDIGGPGSRISDGGEGTDIGGADLA